MRKFLSLIVMAACALSFCACSSEKIYSNPTTSETEATTTTEYTGDNTLVAIEVEDYGTITVELEADKAPITCENFLKLVNEGFYDGLTFHRVISDFMIQGGDPLGNGTGGSDETIYGEFADNGWDTNDISHVRGVISMARSSDYDSASSQFFIVHKDSTYLDNQYAAFGYVVSGMDVVDAIAENTPVTDSNGTVAADDQPVITRMYVVEE